MVESQSGDHRRALDDLIAEQGQPDNWTVATKLLESFSHITYHRARKGFSDKMHDADVGRNSDSFHPLPALLNAQALDHVDRETGDSAHDSSQPTLWPLRPTIR